MTHAQACRELIARLRPWNDLRAKVYMRMPMNYVLNGEVLEPRPSLEAEAILAKIDEATKGIMRDIEREYGRLAGTPWCGDYMPRCLGDIP